MVMASSSYYQTSIGGFPKTTTIRVLENKLKPAPPPPRIFTSINPSDVKVVEVRELFRSANVSCHRFPKFGSDGKVEPVEVDKLSRAISHSTVVVSVFSSPAAPPLFPIPFQTQTQRQLVGFGRAVSDHGLTASIHDVVVLPSLQGLGIGRKIVNRILRILTSRGIYDISALCSENERPFFQTCGFGDDILESTTMVYTKSPSECIAQGDQVVASAGRMVLLVPPLKTHSNLR